MTEFLRATAVIDGDSPAVKEAAEEIVGALTNDEEVARRLFLWVRDNVRHSSDYGLPVVTCTASEVLRYRAGFCYAKSHLLTALLRARGVPAALCYQRLSMNGPGSGFCLHGMVAVCLRRHGWYRIDPRGDKPGVSTDFCPPVERLAFTPGLPGEMDIPGHFPEPLPQVIETLRRWHTAGDVAAHLPDYSPAFT